MNWPIFLSAMVGVIAGVAACCALFWWVFYASGESETSNDVLSDNPQSRRNEMIKAYAWVQGQNMGLSFIKPVDVPEGVELHELQSVSTDRSYEPVVLLMEAHGRKPVPVMADDEKAVTFYSNNGYTASPLVRAE